MGDEEEAKGKAGLEAAKKGFGNSVTSRRLAGMAHTAKAAPGHAHLTGLPSWR